MKHIQKCQPLPTMYTQLAVRGWHTEAKNRWFGKSTKNIAKHIINLTTSQKTFPQTKYGEIVLYYLYCELHKQSIVVVFHNYKHAGFVI